MIIAHRREQDVDIVEISGRLHGPHVEEARLSLTSIIEEGDGKLILDLSLLTFIDSPGCSVLITVLKSMRMRRGVIALCALPRNVRALLELTRIIEVFDVFASTEAAMEAFGG